MDKDTFSYLQKIIYGPDNHIINGNAKEAGLRDAVASKVYGEAILTMESESLLTVTSIASEIKGNLPPIWD